MQNIKSRLLSLSLKTRLFFVVGLAACILLGSAITLSLVKDRDTVQTTEQTQSAPKPQSTDNQQPAADTKKTDPTPQASTKKPTETPSATSSSAPSQPAAQPQAPVSSPPPPVAPPAQCPNPQHSAGGSDGMGGCWPYAGNTGVPDGIVLGTYTDSCVIQTNTVIDRKDVTQKCGELVVRNGARLTVTNSKTPRIESTDEGNLGSVNISYSNIDAPGWVEGSLWGYNLTADRVEITGGQHSYHCNSNCTLSNSWLHAQYNPNGGSTHNNAFISNGGDNMTLTHNTLHCDAILNATDGGCTADVSLFGDFDPISNVTVDKNLLMANNSSISYCAYGGYSPGKPYPNATGIVFRDNVFQRGANNKCGVYGAITSFQTGAPGNLWSNNKWSDGTVLNP